jgi:hypothetical protein
MINQILQILVYVVFAAFVVGIVLYVVSAIRRARRSQENNPFDDGASLEPDFDYDPKQLIKIQNWNAQNRPPLDSNATIEALIQIGYEDEQFRARASNAPELWQKYDQAKPYLEAAPMLINVDDFPEEMRDELENAPPLPDHLKALFDQNFIQPRVAREAGARRLLEAINQDSDEDAKELIEGIIESIENSNEFDKADQDGKLARDGHSAAWHGFFVLANALSYLRGDPLLYIEDEISFGYKPIFTRAGENWLSSWESARARWNMHSADHFIPGFTESHEGDICDMAFAWDCPECGARVNAIGEDMPEAIDHGGRCGECHFHTKGATA